MGDVVNETGIEIPIESKQQVFVDFFCFLVHCEMDQFAALSTSRHCRHWNNSLKLSNTPTHTHAHTLASQSSQMKWF